MADSLFQSIGAVKAFDKTENGFEFRCEHGLVRVTALADGIVRVRATQAAISARISRTRSPKRTGRN